MRNSPQPILHLVHPRPISWSSVIGPVSHALSLPVVPYAEWLARLRSTQAGTDHSGASEVQLMQANPGLMLLDFFAHAVSSEAQREDDAMGIRTLDVTKALQVAPSLTDSHLPQLEEKDIMSWVGYWRRIGFLG